MKGKTDNSKIILEDFNTILSIMDRTTREINKGIQNLANTINQPDLTTMYRILHPTTKCTFFSHVQEAFSKTDQAVGHKMNFHKCKGWKYYKICSLTSMKLNYKSKGIKL